MLFRSFLDLIGGTGEGFPDDVLEKRPQRVRVGKERVADDAVELFFDELGANVVAALDRGKGPGLLGCHCFLLVFCEARVRIEL